MAEKKRVTEIREEVLDRKPQTLTKKVGIIFDGKQYNIRIPLAYAKKAQIDPEQDAFEFTLEIPEDKSELPILHGEVVEKEEITREG